MILTLKEGVRVIVMPYGDAIVIDRAQLGVQQISAGLAALFQHSAVEKSELPPPLVEEIRRNLADGWMSVKEVP